MFQNIGKQYHWYPRMCVRYVKIRLMDSNCIFKVESLLFNL